MASTQNGAQDSGIIGGGYPEVPRYECVIPAAGFSSRMGDFKPLVLYKGEPLIVHVVRNILRVCTDLYIVTGYRASELDRHFADVDGVHTVFNPDYSRGMIGSIAAGARHVAGDWYFVAPGDMPELSTDVFNTLATHVPSATVDTAESAYLGESAYPGEIEASDVAALFPAINGRRGHPVLISSRTTTDLVGRYRAYDSMREFLKDHTVLTVEFPDVSPYTGMFYDVDRPEDVVT